VRVLGYNIRHGQGEDGWVSNARISRVISDVGADVVALSEVWQLGSFYDQPARLAHHLGLETAFAANAGIGPLRQGNMVLTRGKIVRWENLTLPHKLEHRGCLVAEIDLDGERFVFASTHLSLEREVRRAQMEMLVRELPRDLPLIMVGDMNCADDELEPLRSRFELTPPVPSYPAFWPVRPLDYVAFSEHWELRGVATVRTSASDHLPLVSRFDLRPGPQA
jgi:endonuclease/exonuclease/phosphatase family metal-dependent hydrolase